MTHYRIFICGPTDCPNDDGFEHDNYFGCVPKDFSPGSGRSRNFRQTETSGRWFWNGGCDEHHRRAEHLEVAR